VSDYETTAHVDTFDLFDGSEYGFVLLVFDRLGSSKFNMSRDPHEKW
jgi:hypothetical protein